MISAARLPSTASRREVLKASGALMLVMAAPAEAVAAAAAAAKAAGKSLDPTDLDNWLALAANGEVTAYFGKGDVGQGVDVAIAQIVAEELDVPIDHVTVIMSDTALTLDQGGVAGSQAMMGGAPPMRFAAAEARRVLLERASDQLKVPVEKLKVVNGVVFTPDGRKRTYGQLSKSPFGTKLKWNGETRNTMKVQGLAKPKTPDQYKVVGTSPPRRDVDQKVFGKWIYSADVRLPGMLHGRVIRPPIAGAKPLEVDEASIAQIKGARFVRKGDFLGVVAPREWDAIRASRALKVTWSQVELPFFDSEKLFDHIREVKAVNHKETKVVGNVDAAFKAPAGKLVEAEYEWPFQSHASLGPACAVADSKPDHVTVWSPSQKPHAAQRGISKMLGLPLTSVHSIFTQGAGSYGRNDGADAGADAVMMSLLAEAPVRVQNMRPDGHGWDPKAPASVHTCKAVIGSDGKMVAYEYKSKAFNSQDVGASENEAHDLLVGMAVGFNHTPEHTYAAPSDGYVMPNYRASWEVVPALMDGPSPLRTSNLRDPLGTQIHFASESFIDECAHAAGADPVQFRLDHVPEQRAKDVILAAAKAAAWGSGPAGSRRSQNGTIKSGRGFAYAGRGTTIVAMVVDVDVDTATGRVWPRRYWVSHDCGLIINPGTLKNVIEGNVVFGTSRALFEEVRFDT